MNNTRPQHARLLVTGASRGIGRAVAVALGAHYEGLLLASRSEADLKDTASLLACPSEIFPVDISNPVARGPLCQRLREKEYPVTDLVHCAGDGLPLPIERLEISELCRLHELHLHSLLEFIQAMLPNMKLHNYGRIVAISSLAPLRPAAYLTAYAASKAAMRAAVQCLADELVSCGITLNLVSPGHVETRLGNAGRASLAALAGRSAESLATERLRHLPGSLPLAPEDVARVASFLVTPSTSAITGQDIVVAGSLLMR